MTWLAAGGAAVAPATRPVTLSQAFAAEESSPTVVNSHHQPKEGEQAHAVAEDDIQQPWYHCMLPDCSGTSSLPEEGVENELLATEEAERRQEDEGQETEGPSATDGAASIFRASEPDAGVRDTSLCDEEERDAEDTDNAPCAPSPTAATTSVLNEGQHRRSLSDVGTPTNPIEGIPDTFFSTGSFESISGLSLAS